MRILPPLACFSVLALACGSESSGGSSGTGGEGAQANTGAQGTGEVTGGFWVWSIYTPYATETSTGLPTTPQVSGAPWIMRPGTASSHIMVVQPREPKPAAESTSGSDDG